MTKGKSIYAPGELKKVRERLGVTDECEAKRLQKLLGGEVGFERAEDVSLRGKDAGAILKSSAGVSGIAAPNDKTAGKPKRVVELLAEEDTKRATFPLRIAVSPRTPYSQRVRMDSLAAESDFSIKTSFQVLVSRLTFFGQPEDFVCSYFVMSRLADYYRFLETLVNSTRILFPRNNQERNTVFRKKSGFAFRIMDTIRQWKIETISQEIGKLQAHPRQIQVRDMVPLLREVYRPLFILEQLDHDAHIAPAYRLYYDFIAAEKPNEASYLEEKVTAALYACQYIRANIPYRLYPLLLKLSSDHFLSYQDFFKEKRDWYLSFIGVCPEDQYLPPKSAGDGNYKADSGAEETGREQDDSEGAGLNEKEGRALEKAYTVLETLFPKAQLNQLESFPDIYPYFRKAIDLFKNSDILAPEDPALQMIILAIIIQDLFYAFRFILFSSTSEEGDVVNTIVNDWNTILSNTFERLYLERVVECGRAFENSNGRISQYTGKIQNDIHWIRRLYFFPYYQFTSVTSPSFKKENITAFYPLVRNLRRSLTVFSMAIEEANKAGGMASRSAVKGIENPWEPYHFEIGNSLSKRLDALLPFGKRSNAALIVFTLAVVTVLDFLLNNPDSWAYNAGARKMFRSSDTDGRIPASAPDRDIDVDALFKLSLEKRLRSS